MTFTIEKTTFSSALSRIQGITSGRSTMPILSNVLLQVSPLGHNLQISATDLEVGYTTVIDLQDQAGGAIAITLPAKKLHEIVKACPAHDIIVDIDLDNQRVKIASGTYSATLPGLDAGEFPELPQVEGESFDLDASALLQILGHVAYAQSNVAEKYNLNGCFLRMEANPDDELFLMASATDGHRLALDSVPLPGEPRPIPKDLAKGIIISSKGIAELRKIRNSGIIVLSIAGNHLQVTTETEKLFFRLVDGKFPDVDRVIPRKLTGRAEVKRQALIESLERCRILSDGQSHRTCLGFAEGGIAIRSTLPELCAEASDRVTADVSVPPCDIFLNADYLLDALGAMDSSFVSINLTDGDHPLLITPLGTDEPLAVIMPQRE